MFKPFVTLDKHGTMEFNKIEIKKKTYAQASIKEAAIHVKSH